MRVDLVERFEKLVADYNAGSINVETFFQELVEFKKTLSEEEAVRSPRASTRSTRRLRPPHAARPGADRGREDAGQEGRRRAPRDAQARKLVLDWRKQQATRAAVRVAVEETLDRLPEKFTRQIYAQKCDAVYQHVFDSTGTTANRSTRSRHELGRPRCRTGPNTGTHGPENAKRPVFTGRNEYRYRDSNPGFRHERAAS